MGHRLTLWDVCIGLIIVGIAVYMAWTVNHPMDLHLAYSQVDDGYYYFGYSWNISRGNGFTFDGHNTTNGVQPLWFILSSLIGVFVHDRITFIYAVMGLASLLAVGSAVMLKIGVQTFLSKPATFVVVALYAVWIMQPHIMFSGLETPIAVFSLATAIAIITNIPQPVSNPHLVGIGTLLGLVALARLDYVLLLPTFVVFALWQTNHLSIISRKNLPHIVLSGAYLSVPAVSIVLVYFALNLSIFGFWQPISASVKWAHTQHVIDRIGIGNYLSSILSDLPRVIPRVASHELFCITPRTPWIGGNVALWGTLVASAVYAAIVSVFIGAVRELSCKPALTGDRRQWMPTGAMVYLLFALNLLIHLFILLFRMPSAMIVKWHWYHVPLSLFVLVTFGMLVDAIRFKFVRGITAVIFPLFFIWAGLFIYLPNLWSMDVARLERRSALYNFKLTAGWLNDNIDPDTRIGVFDAGVIGYYTDASVINLDGLMGDNDLLTRIENQESILPYIHDNGIDMIVNFELLPQREDLKGIPKRCLDGPQVVREYSHYGRNARMVLYQVVEGCV